MVVPNVFIRGVLGVIAITIVIAIALKSPCGSEAISSDSAVGFP
jgi:hypothetical protein